MISRSETGPRCTHCSRINPAAVLEPSADNVVICIHCEKPFRFWIERLPFYTTDDGRQVHCTCDFCTGKVPAPGYSIGSDETDG